MRGNMVFETVGNDLNLIKNSVPFPYSLEFYDRDSIEEIRRCIKEHFYNNKKTILEHLEYLDHLFLKLQSILQLETSYGVPIAEIKKDLVEINLLKNQLSALLNQFA
jgi:hypothetical protein